MALDRSSVAMVLSHTALFVCFCSDMIEFDMSLLPYPVSGICLTLLDKGLEYRPMMRVQFTLYPAAHVRGLTAYLYLATQTRDCEAGSYFLVHGQPFPVILRDKKAFIMVPARLLATVPPSNLAAVGPIQAQAGLDFLQGTKFGFLSSPSLTAIYRIKGPVFTLVSARCLPRLWSVYQELARKNCSAECYIRVAMASIETFFPSFTSSLRTRDRCHAFLNR